MDLLDVIKNGGLASKDNSMDEQLAVIKKYDPNATIETRGGGDGDGSAFQQIQYDQSKLPKMKEGYTENFFLDKNGNDTSSHVGFTPRTGATNKNKIYDPNYGWIVPTSDVGSIDEKANNAQQNKEGGLFSTIGNALVPSDKPWMVIPEVIGAGLASSGLSGFEKAAANFGLNAATTGGKSLTDPMAYLGAGVGALGNMLPPELMQTLGYVKSAYGWIKNPIGSAANMAGGMAMNGVTKLFGGN